MPNWITNMIKASGHVIKAMLDENSCIDFNRIIPFDGEFPWNYVSGHANYLAKALTRKAESDYVSLLPTAAFKSQDIIFEELSDDEFEQFVQMLRNFRKSKVLHYMDFARKHWGTKWNACESKTDLDAGITSFQTAHWCPKAVLQTLSEQFPQETIEVRFADEELGNYCGTFTLEAGKYIASDIAPEWFDQTDEEKAKWFAFACVVNGHDPVEFGETN